MPSRESMAAAFNTAVPRHWDVTTKRVHGSPHKKFVAESPNGRWMFEVHTDGDEWGVSLSKLKSSSLGPGQEIEHQGTRRARTPAELQRAVRKLLAEHTNVSGRGGEPLSEVGSTDRAGDTAGLFDDLGF